MSEKERITGDIIQSKGKERCDFTWPLDTKNARARVSEQPTDKIGSFIIRCSLLGIFFLFVLFCFLCTSSGLEKLEKGGLVTNGDEWLEAWQEVAARGAVQPLQLAGEGGERCASAVFAQ